MIKSFIITAIVLITAPAVAFDEKHLAVFKALNTCEKCDLNRANLRGANLSGANFTGAKLKNAKLDGATLCETKMPWGIEHPECNSSANKTWWQRLIGD